MTSTTIFFLFIPFLAVILLGVNLIFAPHKPYQEKNSVFECGYHSFLGQNRTQFSVSFFIFALLFLLFDLEILLIYPYIVSSYTITIYGLITMIIFFLVLTLGFQYELGKKALNIYSRQFNIIKYIYILRLSKQSNLFYSLYCLNINTLLKYISNYIFNKLYYILIHKVKSYLTPSTKDIILNIYNKYLKVFILRFILRFIKLAYDMFSIFSINNIVCLLINLSLFIALTYLFYIYKPELCNLYIVFSIFSICINSILLIITSILLVYINYINVDFKHKYPLLYISLNIICIIVIYCCIFSILFSIYTIYVHSYDIFYEIVAKLGHYIYIMTGHGSTGGTDQGGSSTGNTGNPGPSDGGGRGPNGSPDPIFASDDSNKRKRETSDSEEDTLTKRPRVNEGNSSVAEDVNHGHAELMWIMSTRRNCVHNWNDYFSFPCLFQVAPSDRPCSQVHHNKICNLCNEIRCRTHAQSHYPINSGASLLRKPFPPKP